MQHVSRFEEVFKSNRNYIKEYLLCGGQKQTSSLSEEEINNGRMEVNESSKGAKGIVRMA
jgi:hypothetical protein